MTDKKELFGIWGGSTPGGWCFISRPNSFDYEIVCGTREEAEAGCAVFLREQAEYNAQYPDPTRPLRSYEVIPFDPEREPVGSEITPTHAQRMALECVERVGTWNVMGCPPRHVRAAVEERGWVMHRSWLKGKPIVLTAAGRRALAKARRQ